MYISEYDDRAGAIQAPAACGPVDAAPARGGHRVLDTFIDSVSWDEAIARIVGWARTRESRAVYLCNVHAVVTARRDAGLQAALEEGDLVAADGAPVAWRLRRAGFEGQQRISGPELMMRALAAAEVHGLRVLFFGERQATLDLLRARLLRDFPALQIVGMISPPFSDPTPQEARASIDAINASGAQLVFVALGCPKQEKWIAAHRGAIRATMLGVGAAFAFQAGVVPRSPLWMQRYGLEWLFRLAAEPRRLWRRYLVTNSVFIATMLREFLAGGISAREAIGARGARRRLLQRRMLAGGIGRATVAATPRPAAATLGASRVAG